MSLTKHCPGCSCNLGINYFYVDEDGNWSEKCKFCQPKPKVIYTNKVE